MTPLAETTTNIFSFGILVAQIIIVALIISIVAHKTRGPSGIGKLAGFFRKYVLEIGFLVSLGSMLGSLFYSNILGYEPCEFCWWQRIMLYPQTVLFAVAMYYKKKLGIVDSIAIKASLILSSIGAALALFQYYGQMFDPSLLAACVATGPSCSKLYFVSYGYITIPMMSLTAFALLIVTVLTHKKA